MKDQMIFQRYEMKYLLTKEQRDDLQQRMRPFMRADEYGKSVICNIYFDTPTHLLIRRSLEKPVYKEKLRLRSYGLAGADTPVFVELKKKYKSVVYKRRMTLPNRQAMEWLCGKGEAPGNTQIQKEIQYALDFYKDIFPAVFLSYEREAWYSVEDENFRVTMDENILWRRDHLSLGEGIFGTPILEPGQVLMEVKTASAIPVWMSRWLSENKVYKTSFSKYGNAYEEMENQKRKGGEAGDWKSIQRAV